MSDVQWSFSEFDESAEQLGAGSELGGYRIVEVLGAGGMGRVYRARDLALQRDVAIKLSTAQPWSEERLRRFAREGELLASLSHPRILPVYGGGALEGGAPFLITALIEGAQDLRRHCEGLLPLERLERFAELTEALAYAHAQGVVHRDLKPENVLVDERGQLYLCDFGLAWGEGVDDLTRSNAQLGTPLYAAPEQLLGLEARDPRADVYSLGVILCELLRDEHPFAHVTTMHELIAAHTAARPRLRGVSKPLAEVVRCAMDPDPARRYPDAGALAGALAQARQRAQPRSGASRALLAGLALAALSTLAAGAWLRTLEEQGRASEPSPSPTPQVAGSLVPARFSVDQAAEQALTKGLDLLYGRGVAQDLEAAAMWLDRARQQGHPLGAQRLAGLLLGRELVSSAERLANRERARALLEGALAEGPPSCARCLAHILSEGEPAEQARARELYAEAAQKGDAQACYWACLQSEEDDPAAARRFRDLLRAQATEQAEAAYYAALLDYRDARRADDEAAAARARAEIERVAEEGNSSAQVWLAETLEAEGGYERAFVFAQLAASQGSRIALRLVGLFHLRGQGGAAPDPPRGVHYLLRASRLGDAESMYRYALCLRSGQGRDAPDLEESWKWVEASAGRGFATARFDLGFELLIGSGRSVLGEPSQGLAILRQLHAAGDPHGTLGVGVAYLIGRGVPRDRKRGRQLLLESARRGQLRSYYYLGLDALDERTPAARVDAVRWLGIAARSGDLQATLKLARVLRASGDPAEARRARRLLERAAARGSLEAQGLLTQESE